MSAISTGKQPISTDPGYLMTVSHGGSDYQVFIYIRDANGTKSYLPSSCDPQTIDKIRGLTSGLLNAHDSRRISLREAPYALNGINSKGVIKKNNTMISHDFLIQPVSVLVADQMASAISSPGNPIDASAIKAKDIWTTMEETFRREMKRPSTSAQSQTEQQTPDEVSLPAQSATSQPAQQPLSQQLPNQSAAPSQPQQAPQILTPTQPVQQIAEQVPAQTPPVKPSHPIPQPLKYNPPHSPNSDNADNLLVVHGPGVTASDLNLRGFDFGRSDWYEKMSDRIKFRIITDILAVDCHQGGIYEKVWKLFETRAGRDPSVTTIGLLEKEKRQLSLCDRSLPSAIPTPVRREAAQILEAYHDDLDEIELQEKIVALMEKEIERKEELFQCIREQAIAEGVAIEDWDRSWAQYHYLESTYRFVQALARWLDTN